MSDIEYPRDDKFESAIKCAISHGTYIEGLNWLMSWEHERACKSRDRAQGGLYETLFRYCIEQFDKAWREKMKSDAALIKAVSNVPGGWALAFMLRDDVTLGDFRNTLVDIIRDVKA